MNVQMAIVWSIRVVVVDRDGMSMGALDRAPLHMAAFRNVGVGDGLQACTIGVAVGDTNAGK